MIDVRQVHDVFPNIPGISIYRMLQKPIVDCVYHIQNISKNLNTSQFNIFHIKILKLHIIWIPNHRILTVFSFVGRISCKMRLVRGLAISLTH